MRTLLLNQAFYPDVVATAQYAADLAAELTAAGHQVTVIASRTAYDDAARKFSPRETWRGVRIIRIAMFGFGKSSRWRRALDFGSFMANCFLRTMLLPRFDLVIALTSPPLISALGALLVRARGGKFVFWVMDLNPDEAIAAGWIQPDTRAARLLSAILNYSLRHSDRVIALDRFMARRLAAKGVPEQKISVIPPWSHDEAISYTLDGRNSFRELHGLRDKFVVMYSGNHSPCHPLDTILQTARRLGQRDDIVFCFVGGGSEFRKVRDYAAEHHLSNIRCIPYQPLDRLAASLSAADLHLVVMGNPFVGIVHPSKVYNIRRLGIPFLYIGPEPSHVLDLLPAASFRHGDVEGVLRYISECRPARTPPPPDVADFSQRSLAGRLVAIIDSASRPANPRVSASQVSPASVVEEPR